MGAFQVGGWVGGGAAGGVGEVMDEVKPGEVD